VAGMAISNSEIKAAFTLFAGDGPNTKIISLKDGKLDKQTTMNFTGVARRTAASLAELAPILDEFPKNCAFMPGVTRLGEVRIGPADYLKEGEISRSNEEFYFGDGPGFLVFDYDADGVGDHYTPNELVELIDTHAAPGVARVERLQRMSTSAAIYDADGREMSKAQSGCHIIMVVSDATDIPRIGKLILDRLTLNGHGHCRLSTVGSILHRGPVDVAIYQANRLMYEAPPILKDGLVQRRPPTEHIEGNPCYDSKACPSLTPDELVQLAAIRAANAEVVKPRQEAVRREYSAKEGKRTGRSPEAVYQSLLAYEQGVIDADQVVFTKDGVATTPQKLHDLGKSAYIKNPFEPELANALFIRYSEGGAEIKLFNHGESRLRVQNLRLAAPLPPAYPVSSGSVEAARVDVEKVVASFRKGVNEYWADEDEERPEMLLITPTGTGKSTAVRKSIPGLVADSPGLSIVYAVPNHSLGREQEMELARDLSGTGVKVRVYRGRKADNLDRPTGNPDLAYEKMCVEHEDAAKVSAAHGDVFKMMCKGENRNCPHFSGCAYLAQQSETADVWIVPHHLLMSAKPKCIGTVAAVIVDEDITPLMFHGVDKRYPVHVSIDEMVATIRALRKAGEDAAYIRAASMLEGMVPVLEGLTSGTVNKRSLLRAVAEVVPFWDDAPNAVEALTNLNSMIWGCMRKVEGVEPGQSAESRAAALERVSSLNEGHRRVGALVRIIRDHMEAAPDGWFHGPDTLDELKRQEDALWKSVWRFAEPGYDRPTLDNMAKRFGVGDTSILPGMRRVDDGLDISWLKERKVGWLAPTLFMDATAKPEVYKSIFPAIGDNVTEVECSAPYMNVRQVTDWNGSRNKIVPNAKGDKKENIAHVAQYIEGRAAQFKGKGGIVDGKPIDVLVITYKDTREILEKIALPNVEYAHFGKLVGMDRWKNVACVIVVGGAVKGVDAIECRAELLKGDALDPLDHAFGEWYAVEKVEGRRRDKKPGPALTRYYHNDPLAEALRWQMTEGELMQAIGRGRGVLRGPDDTLQVDILTNVPLPGAVDEFCTRDELFPTWGDRLAARGIIMECGTGTRGFYEVAAAVLGTTAKRLKNHVFDTERRGGGGSGVGSLTVGISYSSTLYTIPTVRDGSRKFLSIFWGRAKIRIGRYAVPIFFAPEIDLAQMFGPEARIDVLEPSFTIEKPVQAPPHTARRATDILFGRYPAKHRGLPFGMTALVCSAPKQHC
jgi:hypothetical protein